MRAVLHSFRDCPGNTAAGAATHCCSAMWMRAVRPTTTPSTRACRRRPARSGCCRRGFEPALAGRSGYSVLEQRGIHRELKELIDAFSRRTERSSQLLAGAGAVEELDESPLR